MSKTGNKKRRVNRKYKDRLFRLIFRDPESRLALYNAVNHTAYTNVEDLQIEELSDAIYMKMYNDLSFVFQFQLNIYEHQSTPNPNMPLRSLYYVADLLQRVVDDAEIYRSRRVPIPEPRFIVFYNGTTELPEQEEYRLSEMFEKPSADPQIELRVRLININPGCNPQIVNACEQLQGYAKLTEYIRYYRMRAKTIEEAVDQAMDRCIKEKILTELFQKYRSEVRKMVLYEYDEERVLQVLKEDAREDGFIEGREEGFSVGRAEGLEEGRAEGLEEGREEGRLSSVRSLMQSMQWSADQAMDALQIPAEDRTKLAEKLK